MGYDTPLTLPGAHARRTEELQPYVLEVVKEVCGCRLLPSQLPLQVAAGPGLPKC